MGYDVKRFICLEDWAQEFICSICMGVFEDPVETKCLHTFCLDCITKWLATNSTCPLDMMPISRCQDLKPLALISQNQLGLLQIHCDFEELGCDQIVKLSNLPDHVAACPFRPKRLEQRFFNDVSKMFSRITNVFRRRFNRLNSNLRPGRFNLQPRPTYQELARRRLEREDVERGERVAMIFLAIAIFSLVLPIIASVLRMIFDLLQCLSTHGSVLLLVLGIYILKRANTDFFNLDIRVEDY